MRWQIKEQLVGLHDLDKLDESINTQLTNILENSKTDVSLRTGDINSPSIQYKDSQIIVTELGYKQVERIDKEQYYNQKTGHYDSRDKITMVPTRDPDQDKKVEYGLSKFMQIFSKAKEGEELDETLLALKTQLDKS